MSLPQSPVKLAHLYWKSLVKPGDTVIDATCGNGWDTIQLAQLVFPRGKVFSYDIQNKALVQAQKNAENSLPLECQAQIHYCRACHSEFSSDLSFESVSLVVYNLGYLPGSNKEVITLTETTLNSIRAAQGLLKPKGWISIITYPRHTGGFDEEQAIMEFARALSPLKWNVCYHSWINRLKGPNLLILEKM